MSKYKTKILLILCLGVVSCSNESGTAHEADGSAEKLSSSSSTKVLGNGPFGIDAGTQLADLSTSGERDAETGVSILKSAPKASTQFPEVAVISYPFTGVCEIRSVSSVFESDAFIASSSAFVDEVASALKAKYGDVDLDDKCSGYSCRSEYKLQAIEDGSRWYGYTWKNSDKIKLPNRLSEINLYITHSEFNNSVVRLDYVFDNTAICSESAKKAKASAL